MCLRATIFLWITATCDRARRDRWRISEDVRNELKNSTDERLASKPLMLQSTYSNLCINIHLVSLIKGIGNSYPIGIDNKLPSFELIYRYDVGNGSGGGSFRAVFDCPSWLSVSSWSLLRRFVFCFFSRRFIVSI